MKTVGLVLALLSTPAWAQWTLLGEPNDFDLSVYVDPAGRRVSDTGNIVKIPTLLDLKNPGLIADGRPYFSIKSQEEFDCVGKRHRSLYSSWYSGHMASGEVISSGASPPYDWTPVEPKTLTEFGWKIACKK